MAESPPDNELFGSDLWQVALEKYARATHLTVRLFDAEQRAVFGPVSPTPLFQLFDETGYDPGIFAECVRRCVAQIEKGPVIVVSQLDGLAVVGTSLMLEDRTVGAAVCGYAFADFSQVSEIQRLARQADITFERLWHIARQQQPVSRQRLIVQGELLQVLGDALLREHYRRRQYEQAAAIVNSSDDAIFSEDLQGIATSWNVGAEHLFGYSAQEAIGTPVRSLVHRDGPAEEQGLIDRIGRGEKIDHYDSVYRRKDESPVEISLTASPVREANGRMIGISRIARDISERKRHEKHLELIMHELNHRVKNSLAIVQAIASQSLRNGVTLAEGRKAFEARLLALAKAHDVLTHEHWEGAGLGTVVADAVAAYSDDKVGSRFQLAGPAVRLLPRAVLALSMALHELATNAIKYGALSNGTGHISITWTVAGNPKRFQLEWAETEGPPVANPQRRGFGSRMIERALARDLGGEVRLEFVESGLVCKIDALLSKVAV